MRGFSLRSRDETTVLVLGVRAREHCALLKVALLIGDTSGEGIESRGVEAEWL